MKHLLLIFFISPILLFSQKDTSRIIQYIDFGFHYNIYSPVFADQDYFLSINKTNNPVLIKSTAAYKLNNFGYSSTASVGSTISVGFKMFPELPNSTSRFSLSFEQNYFLHAYYYNDSTKFIGKVSSTTPATNTYYLYEKKNSSITYKTNIKSCGFSFSQLLQTNRQKYFSFYTGLMLSADVSVQSEIEAIAYSNKDKYRIDSITGKETRDLSGLSDFTFEYTKSKAKTFVYTGVGIIAGFELRFSKTRKRLKHLSLKLETVTHVNFILTPKMPKQTVFVGRLNPFTISYRF
jgi:hypothetical protein